MFGIGGFELFLIILFGFLIVGPDKLPDLAKTVGKAIAKFRNAQQEMNQVIKKTDLYDPASDEPFKNPLEALEKAGTAASGAVTAAKAGVTKAAEPAASVGASDAAAKPESFSERKARYERERAAKHAAEREAAAQAQAQEAQGADAGAAQPAAAATPAQTDAATADAAADNAGKEA